MTELVTLDDNIVEFNDPRLGIDPQGLQKWAHEVQETASKTDRLAKIIIEIRMIKWTTPEVTESERIEDGKTITTRNVILQRACSSNSEIELDKEDNFEEYDFEDEVEDLNKFLDKATSYGVVFTMKAYQSNDTVIAAVSRKFGRLDLSELKKAWEVVNKPIELPPMKIQSGGRTITIPSRPISRPMPPINPEMEFKKLFADLESR